PYFYGDEHAALKVAVIDYGCKRNILECFAQRGCYLKVFPARTELSTIDAWEPDGYFLSNGPGDPAAMDYAIKSARKILDSNKPVFGICLGHQLLALAQGMKTEKLKYGHRGTNHPVLNTSTGLGEITSQNHGFGVVKDSLIGMETEVEVSHYNLNDGSLEGLRWKNKRIFTVQYHPESSPGPFDSRYLFDEYIAMLKVQRGIPVQVNA
ncbi:MAG TPA: carbamoyl phosphate synthase small subunit, partial [Saprospiraceae bacterium]|nr:carbamoyl phosphate synthase small subunit [Saprospiraceae bacterium]